ncbi:hypothetical protein SLNSH_14685 [Alsobacter soli]|uniref:Uncharacterized protein n=1 Tax=Alsobacter soli TaxID=2109933 RepID=A0A2T1HRG7_9HYPH|nr:hypothetical protein [Alsobacter soli]PSC04237.1 hypothetical protein SLNSH_14685 [Alsobacter soli]
MPACSGVERQALAILILFGVMGGAVSAIGGETQSNSANRVGGSLSAATGPASPEAASALNKVVSLKVVEAPLQDVVNFLAGEAGLQITWRARTDAVVQNWRNRGPISESLSALARAHSLFVAFDGTRLEVHSTRDLDRAVLNPAPGGAQFAEVVRSAFPWTSEPLVRFNAAEGSALLSGPAEILRLIKFYGRDEPMSPVHIIRYGRADPQSYALEGLRSASDERSRGFLWP